jgi:hypothetical protein
MMERSSFSDSGPILRCNKCHKLGHINARYLSSNKIPSASVREVLSCTREERNARTVGRDNHKLFQLRPWRTRGKVLSARTDLCRAPSKEWIKSGNEGMGISSNPKIAQPRKWRVVHSLKLIFARIAKS